MASRDRGVYAERLMVFMAVFLGGRRGEDVCLSCDFRTSKSSAKSNAAADGDIGSEEA